MLPHLSTSKIEMQNCIKINLSLKTFIQKILYLKRIRAYLITPDGYESLGTHWMAL